MKILKILVIIAFILAPFYQVKSQAAELTFIWDANTEPDLAGYRIYQAEKQGNVSTEWVKVGETTETTFTLTVPDRKGFIFCVTAFGTSGDESFPSNVALHSWKPGKPKNLIKQ